MAAVQDVSYNGMKNSTNERIRNIVLDGSDSSKASIVGLVNEYQASFRNICIPNNLTFLKSLSEYYTDTIRKSVLSPAIYGCCDLTDGSQE